MTTPAPDPAWVADPGIAWRILLTATLEQPLDAATARAALARLHADQAWTRQGTVVAGDDAEALRRLLGARREPSVDVGIAGRHVVVAAHHSLVDGLGLLDVLAAVTARPVTSSARGVGERPDAAGAVATVGRRLAEVVVAPPARVAGPAGTTCTPRSPCRACTAPATSSARRCEQCSRTTSARDPPRAATGGTSRSPSD